MTVPMSVDPAGLVREHLESASPDLLRGMVKTFAEADAICGAPYGQRSEERVNQRNGYRPREWDTRLRANAETRGQHGAGGRGWTPRPTRLEQLALTPAEQGY